MVIAMNDHPTDPGGIGGVLAPTHMELHIESPDGQTAELIARDPNNGRWMAGDRLTPAQVVDLVSRAQAVLVPTQHAVSPLESVIQNLNQELESLLLADDCRELITQLRFASLILASSKSELWTAADFDYVLKSDALANEWQVMADGDADLTAQIRQQLETQAPHKQP